MTGTNQQHHDNLTCANSAVKNHRQGNITMRNIVVLTLVFAAATALGAMLRFPAVAAPQNKPESSSSGYAKAYLQLAEAQLAYAEQLNRSAPGTFTEPQLKDYRNSVEICQTLMKQEEQSGQFDRMTAMAHWAQHRMMQAQTDVVLAQTINQKIPGTISGERIKELQAYADLAQLDSAAGQAALKASPEKQLQWRVSVLEDQMLRLSKEVSLLQQLEQ
jgi:hypothetical protein